MSAKVSTHTRFISSATGPTDFSQVLKFLRTAMFGEGGGGGGVVLV